MITIPIKKTNPYYLTFTNPASHFALRCIEAMRERWQEWIPWELAVRSGVENSLHFYCHACSNEQPKHLSHLFHVPTPLEIDSVLKHIVEKYKVISTEEYVERLRRRQLRENKVLATVTCDDGLREFKTFLWPIMKKYSIPCTLFLVKDFVEQIQYFYRFKTSLILDKLDEPNAFIKTRDYLSQAGIAIDSPKGLKRAVLGIHRPEDHWVLDGLVELLGVQILTYFEEKRPFLDRNEVIELFAKGVRLGSHGVSHNRYEFLSPQKIQEDILKGVEYIRSLSGQATVEYAFPFIGKKVSRELLNKILKNQSILTHFFDTGGICRDVPFVTHRITLDSLKPHYALRQAAYRYIHLKTS